MKMPSRLIISFDFELGWGVIAPDDWRRRQQQGLYRELRSVVGKLIDLLATTHLPTTWGIVSSSLIEREADLALEHLPAAYAGATRTFFREAEWQTRCSVDLMERWSAIAEFSELGSHSSTHIHAGYPNLSASTWVRDILDSCAAIEHYCGRAVQSLISPRDQTDFRQQLAAVRPMQMRVSPRLVLPAGGWRGALGRLRLQLGTVPLSIVAQGAYGETYHSGSVYLNWPSGRGESLRYARLLHQRRELLTALEHGSGVYHAWLHPFNLARTPRHFPIFADFLTRLVRLRDAGHVEVLTMAQAGGA